MMPGNVCLIVLMAQNYCRCRKEESSYGWHNWIVKRNINNDTGVNNA